MTRKEKRSEQRKGKLARGPKASRPQKPEPSKEDGGRASQARLIIISTKGQPSVAAALRKGAVQPSGSDVTVPQCVMHGVQGIHQDTTSLQDTITVSMGAQEIEVVQKVFIHA